MGALSRDPQPPPDTPTWGTSWTAHAYKRARTVYMMHTSRRITFLTLTPGNEFKLYLWMSGFSSSSASLQQWVVCVLFSLKIYWRCETRETSMRLLSSSLERGLGWHVLREVLSVYILVYTSTISGGEKLHGWWGWVPAMHCPYPPPSLRAVAKTLKGVARAGSLITLVMVLITPLRVRLWQKSEPETSLGLFF